MVVVVKVVGRWCGGGMVVNGSGGGGSNGDSDVKAELT